MESEYALRVRWTAYPLRPDTPEEGLTLAAAFDDPAFDVDAMNARLSAAARKAGVPFGRRSMVFNSRSAQELGKWATDEGRGRAFHHAVFEAYLVEGRNIGRLPVLLDLAAAVGLDPAAARRVLETRAFKAAVDIDWERSLAVDPEYIPALMIGANLLVNPQTYELFEGFMRDNGIPRRTGESLSA